MSKTEANHFIALLVEDAEDMRAIIEADSRFDFNIKVDYVILNRKSSVIRVLGTPVDEVVVSRKVMTTGILPELLDAICGRQNRDVVGGSVKFKVVPHPLAALV